MILCIAGSRILSPTAQDIDAVIVRPEKVSALLSGTARGTDQAGERWAKGRNIPVIRRPADWQKHGKRAGYLRNAEMVKEAGCFLIYWDGKSPGTCNMLKLVRESGKPFRLITANGHLTLEDRS